MNMEPESFLVQHHIQHRGAEKSLSVEIQDLSALNDGIARPLFLLKVVSSGDIAGKHHLPAGAVARPTKGNVLN